MVSSVKRAFRSYNGRHFLSRWARLLFERDSIYAHIGYYLACGLIMASLFEVEGHSLTHCLFVT